MLLRRNDILFTLALAMFICLFISRGALTISMSLFILAAISSHHPVNTLQSFLRSPVLWTMSLLFLIPLMSGIWSQDKAAWLDALRTKLPLLLLPLAFATSFSFSHRQWKILASVLCIMVLLGSFWTFATYLQSPLHFEERYLQSTTLPTLLDNDHVRFSWLTAFSIFLFAWLFSTASKQIFKILIVLAICWLIIFLHILAARTGLICFYIFSFALILRFFIKRTSRVFAGAFVVLMLSLPLIAYALIPTFRNRIKFISYDYGYFKDAHYLPGGNDAIRIISFKAGMQAIADAPAIGHGFGDIKKTIHRWYETDYPEVKEQDRIMPSSQLLIYGVGSGLIGIAALLISIGSTFLIRVRMKFTWLILVVIIALPLLYDVGLEIQYGVFLHAATILFAWKWFTGIIQKK